MLSLKNILKKQALRLRKKKGCGGDLWLILIIFIIKYICKSMFCHGLINGKRQYKPKQIACQGDLYARLQQILLKHAR